VIHFKLYVVIIAFSIIDSSVAVNLPSIRFIRPKTDITADLNKSPGFSSISFNQRGKSKGFIL